jgi:hypothetical protein
MEACKMSMLKHFRNEPLGKSRWKYESSIKLNYRQICRDFCEWMHRTQDRVQSQVMPLAVLKLWVSPSELVIVEQDLQNDLYKTICFRMSILSCQHADPAMSKSYM